jgi:putative ABC transport system permease protein
MICNAGISLPVGGIVILNLLPGTVLERTRPIHIRRPIGTREGDIFRQFLTEAVLISIVGGLIGIAFGFALSRVTASVAGWSTVVATSAIVVACGASVFIGWLFGIDPGGAGREAGPGRGHSL